MVLRIADGKCNTFIGKYKYILYNRDVPREEYYYQNVNNEICSVLKKS